MRKTLGLLSILSIMMAISCALEEKGVIVLTDKDFDKELQNHPNLLVEFYAPWCGHCKQLEPEYEKAAAVLRAQNPPLYLAKVDATVNPELTKKHGIEGYPTLKFYHEGEWIDYSGGRSAEEIVHWYNKKLLPPSSLVTSTSTIEKLKKTDQVSVILFGEQNLEQSPEFKTYLSVTKKFEYIHFYHVTDSKISEDLKVKPLQLLLLKTFDEKSNKFTAEFSETAVFNFISYYSLPLITSFDDRAADVIFEGNKLGLFWIRKNSNTSHTELDNIFLKIAPEYREKIIFVITDIVGEIEENLANYLNLQEDDLPQLRFIDVKGEEDIKNYVYSGPSITEDGVRKFINDFYDGKLSPYLKSQEIPEHQNKPVYELVGKTFQEMVIQSDKHVLVEFYAQWCQHCQALEPIYTKLGEHYGKITIYLLQE
jgi:protein disulfide-isomerase A1